MEIIAERYERRVAETKGADRPYNIPYYMPAVKDAFFERNRELEEAERRRDEEKRMSARSASEEPMHIGELLEEQKTELSPEEAAEISREVEQFRKDRKERGLEYALEQKRKRDEERLEGEQVGQRNEDCRIHA